MIPRTSRVGGAVLVLLAIGIAVLALLGATGPAGPTGPTAPDQPVVGYTAGSGGGAPGSGGGAAAPVGLELPSIGVRAGLVPLGVQPDGTVEVPDLDSPDAGWYSGSPVPGERGPAVILGHVDSALTGPAVFFRLAQLRPGDPVRVTRADGGVAEFRVDRVQRVAKAEFPTGQVYGDLDHPGIRLITCGGVFDGAAGSYRDNVIVYGSAT